MYQKTELKGIEQPIIKRIADNAFIPCVVGNTDYAEYLKWLDAGNIPLLADNATSGSVDQLTTNQGA